LFNQSFPNISFERSESQPAKGAILDFTTNKNQRDQTKMDVLSPTVFQAVLYFQVGLHIAGFVWYFRRRKKFPIPHRKPWLVLMELVFGGLVAISWLIWDAYPWLVASCGTVLILRVYSFLALETCMVVRSSILWLWDLLTRLSIKYQGVLEGNQLTMLNPDEFQIRWIPEAAQVFIVRYRHWIGTKSTIILTILSWIWVTGFFCMLVVVYAKNTFFETSYSSHTCNVIHAQILAFSGLLIGFPCLVMNAQIGISGNDDNFGLFNEMRGMMFSGYVLSLLFGLTQIPQLFSFFFERKYLDIILGLFAHFALLWITTYRIILWTYLVSRKKFVFGDLRYSWKEINVREDVKLETLMSGVLAETVANLPTDVASLFKQLLENPDGKILFERFLAMEYSLENMLFYNATVHYQSLFEGHDFTMNQQTIHRVAFTANAIKEQFISEESLTSVNISAKTRKDALKSIEIVFKRLIAVQEELEGSSQLQQKQSDRSTRSYSIESSKDYEVKYVQMKELSKASKTSDDSQEKLLSTTSEERSQYLKQELKEVLVEFSRLFTEAQEEVYNLMQKDSFTRFMKTSQYQQFIRYNEFASDLIVRGTVMQEEDVPKKPRSPFHWKRIVSLISCLPAHLSYLAERQ
jgi:hypothetical protein